MRDYYSEAEYVLKQLWFDYRGHRYQGRGIITWNPDKGFHIEAFLDQPSKTVPFGRVEFGKVGIVSQSEISSIRMKLQGFNWAIAPNVNLRERFDVLLESRLSINLSQVIFSESIPAYNQDSSWSGSALYETKSKVQLSDEVRSESKINDHTLLLSGGSGIWYEDDQNQRVIGHLIDDRKIQLYWRHSKSLWSKAHSWKWAEAAEKTLSIFFGETISLLRREFRRGSQKYIEVRARKEIESLDWFLYLFGHQYKLDKNLFIYLTQFFACNEQEALVSTYIFNQMIEASRQQSWQATELLVSTVLEAALRTLENCPFLPNDSWNIDGGIKRFRERYLSREWKEICKNIITTHRDLRHRNAHPDWLFTQTGYLSETQREKSLDNMIFLSRFYGYMILALAGVKNLKADFPDSHKDWEPALIIMDDGEATKDPKIADLKKMLTSQEQIQSE